MKQTAVEWLINEIDMQYPDINIKWKEWMVDKAREMEMDQACGFVRDFIDNKCYASFEGCVQFNGTPEGYYDEIFNSDEE
jgi:hypothetical protein